MAGISSSFEKVLLDLEEMYDVSRLQITWMDVDLWEKASQREKDIALKTVVPKIHIDLPDLIFFISF